MDLNRLTSIELLKMRQQCLDRLVRNADEMGRIDTILMDRNFNRLEDELSQP